MHPGNRNGGGARTAKTLGHSPALSDNHLHSKAMPKFNRNLPRKHAKMPAFSVPSHTGTARQNPKPPFPNPKLSDILRIGGISERVELLVRSGQSPMQPMSTRDIPKTILDFAQRNDLLAPVSVPVVPKSWAKVGDCIPNVERLVKRSGGSMLLGWRVWVYPDVLLEAEFHAVWRMCDRNLQDPTPSEIGESRIWF